MLLKKDDELIIDKVVKDFNRAEDMVEQRKSTWENNYRLYKSKIEAKKKKVGRANLFIPYIWPIVEQLKARASQALFDKKPYVSYAGVGPEDVDGAKLMEELVSFQLEERINIPYKFLHVFNSVFIYGTAIALYQWKLEEKKVKKAEPILFMGMKMGERVVEDTITTYDDPDIEIIPIDEFYPDPEGWDIPSCAFVCTRVYRDKAYLEAKEKEGIYKLPDAINSDDGWDSVIDFRDNVNDIKNLYTSDRQKKHEIISYYTDDEIIVVLNRKHVIRKEENPLYAKEKPFKRIVSIPLEKEFYGMSIVEILADLQEELNSTRNQRIDNVSLILNKVFKKRRAADIDDTDLISKPGHVIEMDDINSDLGVIDFPDVTSSAYQEEQIIKNDMQYISAVSEFSRGATPQRRETATTVTTIQEAANVLFNYTIGVIDRTGLLALADAIKKLNQQYMTQEKTLRLWDNAQGQYKYITATPDRIVGSYDVVSVNPKMEAQANKEVRRGQLLEMMDKFSSNPITQPLLNIPELMRAIMKEYDIKDYEKVINPVPPVQPPVQEQPNIPMEGMMQQSGY
jgi:hypothetical protein